MKRYTRMEVVGAAVVLLASFFAVASTRNGFYIGVSHLGGIAYLWPVVAVVALLYFLLISQKKLEVIRYAPVVLGAVLVLVTAYVGWLAKAQLEVFVRMQVGMGQGDWAGHALSSMLGGASPAQAMDTSSVPVPPAYAVGWSVGFYLGLLGALAMLVGSVLELLTPSPSVAPVENVPNT